MNHTARSWLSGLLSAVLLVTMLGVIPLSAVRASSTTPCNTTLSPLPEEDFDWYDSSSASAVPLGSASAWVSMTLCRRFYYSPPDHYFWTIASIKPPVVSAPYLGAAGYKLRITGANYAWITAPPALNAEKSTYAFKVRVSFYATKVNGTKVKVSYDIALSVSAATGYVTDSGVRDSAYTSLSTSQIRGEVFHH
jgi:hypothetical protein